MNSNNNNGSSNNLRSARFQLEFEAASAERECRQSAWLAEDAFELYKRTCEEVSLVLDNIINDIMESKHEEE